MIKEVVLVVTRDEPGRKRKGRVSQDEMTEISSRKVKNLTKPQLC
jgi:hypothetical protein